MHQTSSRRSAPSRANRPTSSTRRIDVLAWSWGVMQSGSMAYGGAGGTRKASFNDFNFTHHIDKATPLLMKACAVGTHIPDGTITVRKAGKGQQEYLIIKMTDVLITSVAMSVVEGAPTGPKTCASVRQGRPRVQAPEGRRVTRRGAALQVRHQGQRGRLARADRHSSRRWPRRGCRAPPGRERRTARWRRGPPSRPQGRRPGAIHERGPLPHHGARADPATSSPSISTTKIPSRIR